MAEGDTEEKMGAGGAQGRPTEATADALVAAEAGTRLAPMASEEVPPTPKSISDSEASSGMTSSISPHYDDKRDIILRLEFISDRQMKTIILFVWGALCVGIALLCFALWAKLARDDSFYLHEDTIPIINVSFASLLVAGVGGWWAGYIRRVVRSNASGKRWSMRRRKGVQMATVELSVQFLNTIFFLIPNAYVLAVECAWFNRLVHWSGWMRWTCWNTLFLMFWVHSSQTRPLKCKRARETGRPDMMMMDGPWWLHWKKLGLWLLLEALLTWLTVYISTADWASPTVVDPSNSDCRYLDWDCSFPTMPLVLLILITACLVTYALLYLNELRMAYKRLSKVAYNKYRMGNLAVRLQARLRVLAIIFFALSSIIFTFVELQTCASYITSWLGYLPMQVVMSVVAVVNSFIYSPKKPDETSILQVWLQEFAWTEKDLPRKRDERSSSLPPDSFESFCMDCEPMFSFETAIKLMYWSFLVYDYQEVEQKQSPFNVQTALSLYDLENFEMMWEKSLDTKCIFGWNDDTVVIAFRGTASLANVKADVQIWRSPFPEDEGNKGMLGWCKPVPLVHAGFKRAYTANGFDERLLKRLKKVMGHCLETQAEARSEKPVNVIVTGHSLGGALATLCAFDIKRRFPGAEYLMNVKCYTFGAPRTGNHAFAQVYNEKVPDTWHIINSDDAVTRAGKFYVLYKRPGHRVFINRMGDLVVRPSYVEQAIRKLPGAGSVRDHLLTSYQRAMMAVVAAQFGSKVVDGGKEGVLSLAQETGTREVLRDAGLSVEEIASLERLGLKAYRQALAQRLKSSSPSHGLRGALLSASSKLSSFGSRSSRDSRETCRGSGALESIVVSDDASSHSGHKSLDQETSGQQQGKEQEQGQPATTPAGTAAPEQQQQLRPQGSAEMPPEILHHQEIGVRQCSGRQCRTVCQLMSWRAQRRTSKQAGQQRGQAAEPEGYTPMCDVPVAKQELQQLSAETEGKPNMAGTSVVGLADSPAVQPEEPPGPVTTTRGDPQASAAFPLVLATSSEVHSPRLPSLPEGAAELDA